MSENFNVTILYGTVPIVFFLVFRCFVCLIIFYCIQDITVTKLFVETISSLGWYFNLERVFDCLCQGFEEAPTQGSVQFSHSVMPDTLQPHGLQHARLPCLSPTPGAYSNSCPLSRWCHPTISSSVVPFSSHLQSFSASGPFQMSQFFASGGQSTGVSASASVLPTNIQDWFPLGWTGWISLQSKGLSRVFSNTTVQKHQLAFFIVQLSHPYLTTGSCDSMDLCRQSNVFAFYYVV